MATSNVVRAIRKMQPEVDGLTDEQIKGVIKGVVSLTTITIAPEMFEAKAVGGSANKLATIVAETLLGLVKL